MFADRQFHQPGTPAGPAHARTAGGSVTRPVRGAQQVLAKGVEEVAFIPVEFQRPVRAAVEIGVHGAAKTDDKGGSRLAMTTHRKANPASAIYEFAAAADDGLLACCSHA